MGVGFIQLITSGYEYNIFNREPQITFFKIYYRRHTNFFINNYEIQGNYLRDNSLLTFNIPKSGDYLSKSFLKISYEENYTELLKEYPTLYCTLFNDILNLYDSFSVKVATFNKDMIKNISIAKVNFTTSNINYLSIMCTDFIDEYSATEIFKLTQNLFLQTDKNGLFYNINQYYSFYGFDMISDRQILENDLVLYMFNQIDFENLIFIRIDILNFKTSFKIKFEKEDQIKYSQLFYLIINNYNNITIVSKIKIDKRSVYISLFYNNSNDLNILYNEIIQFLFKNIKTVNLEIIDNKINSKTYNITDDVFNKILKIVSNIDRNYVIYYDLVYNVENTKMVLFILRDTPFFGNLTINDFNECLITDETEIINISNLCNTKLPTNLYIRLLVTLVCENIISIQEFLKIINQKNYNYFNKLSTLNQSVFNKKILDIFINPKVLILSTNFFKKILYQNNTKNNYLVKNQITPFTNRKISIYQSIIVNFYLYFNILAKFSSRYNQSFNNFDQLLAQLIYLSKTSPLEPDSNIYRISVVLNYTYNNNLFDFVIEEKNNFLLYKNLDSNTTNQYTQNLIFNTFISLITESVNIIKNIYTKKSYDIYQPTGVLSNLFFNSDNANTIYPFPSNLFMYSESLIDPCPEKNINILSAVSIFNKSKSNFYNNLVSVIKKNIDQDFNLFKSNFNNEIDVNINLILKNYLFGEDITNVIDNYYSNVVNDENKYDNELIKNYLYELTKIDFNKLIPEISIPFSVHTFIMENLFKYTDNYLYNNTFGNYKYNKKILNPLTDKCTFEKVSFNQPKIFLNFIFTINSPIYRIYFLYTYFAYMSLDPAFQNYIPNDLIILRNIAFKFITEFIKYFNNINNVIIDRFTNISLDVSLIQNDKYNLINNFLCFDQIDLLNDSYFNYLLSINPDDLSKSLLLMYQSFYFKKTYNTLNESSSISKINDDVINNFINEFRYNYDDKVIILFLEILNTNKIKFNNYDLIYNLVNKFFAKSNLQYDSIVDDIIMIYLKNQIMPSNINFQQLFINTFYYNCYYTIFSVGTIFDNINLNNLNSINNTYKFTIEYNNYSQNNSFYNFKSNDIKQFVNYLDNSNVIGAFKYIYSQFNSLLLSYNILGYQYYLQIISNSNKYINENFTYLLYYAVNEIVFNQCLNRILVYVDKFNTTNNTNVILIEDQYTFINQSFAKTNIICILLLFMKFINSCLSVDVNTFIGLQNFSIDNNFNNYLVTKYSLNIYTECLNEIITILSNSGNLINLDYNTIYIGKNILIENIQMNQYQINYLGYMQKIKSNLDINDTNFKVLYDLLNKFSFVDVIDGLAVGKSSFSTFYSYFNNNLNNYIYQYNKILYSLINGGLNNKTLNVNNLSETSLQEDYINILNILYNNTTYNIQTNIYDNLKVAYSTVNLISNYKDRIVNTLLNTVKYFYEGFKSNYFHTIFFKKCGIIIKTNKLINVIEDNPVNPLDPIENLVQLIGNYCNINILNSLYFEKTLNRLLYLFATDYAISKSVNKQEAYDYLTKNTLYDVVKLYKSNKSPKNTYYKDYKTNNALYEDREVFELFNYQNWSDYISFVQNKWSNVLIGKLDTDPTKTNSFFYYYNTFRNYAVKNFEEILLFKLDDGTPVIDYFTRLINIDELHEFIFNLFVLSEDFAPNDIFNSVVKLKNDYQAVGYISIETNKIKKKIIIYLFFNYLVISLLPLLLIENFSVDLETKFEYNIRNESVDFGINDILTPTNLDIIYFYISESYSLNDNNINKIKININPDLDFYYDVMYIIQNAKKSINIDEYLITLIQKYVSSYELIIGNDNINTDSLAEPPKGITISNVVKRINIVYNNDTAINNFDKYKLTIETIKLIDIGISNTIYDLNNIYYNSTYPESKFISNNDKYYYDTDISNINIIFNLVCSLLKYYNITYAGLNDDINLVIGNLRLGARFINDILEFFKGLSSNYQISYNLTSFDKQNSVEYMYENALTRTSNINIISKIAFDLKKLSIITPSDYDLTDNNINFQKIYLQFFKKYYSYNYNYYNFQNNYTVIYKKLADYYANIIENADALIILQQNNIELYKLVFNQIVNTNLSNKFFSTKSTNPLDYIDNYNFIVGIFKKFNFSFKINRNNVSNTKNLKLQNFFEITNTFVNYEELYNYLISLYYYMLLYDSVEIDISKSNFDLVVFFKNINKFENFNQQYKFNFVNIIYRIKLSIQLIVKIIEYKLNVNLNYNASVLDKILEKVIVLMTRKNIINMFIYSLNIRYQTLYTSIYNIYKIYVNIVEYNKFLSLFAKSIEEIVFYTNGFSIEYNINYVWEKYWKNTIFKYYDYSYNNYEIKDFVLSFDNFFSTIYEYLDFFFDDVGNNIFGQYINSFAYYFLYLFRVLQPDGSYVDIDFNIIYKLIFEQPLNIIGDRLEESIYFSETLFGVLKNVFWSILFYNSIDNQQNKFLDSQILFYNFYLSYINYINLNPSAPSDGSSYNYVNFINTIPKLQILFRIMSNTIANRYIDSESYYSIFESIMLSSNKFVYNGKVISTLDISSSPATFLDFVNKNFINKNIINNYYKTIQDETVKNIIEYDIYNFFKQENNLDNFSVEIYNKYTNDIQIFEENNISSTIINNTIVGIINNYSSEINKLFSTDNRSIIYVTEVISSIIDNIKINLDVNKNILGGFSSKFDNIYLSTSNIITLFNGKAFVFDENIITIFTLIYNKLQSFINNDLTIILFYYNCYLAWLSTYGNNYTYNLDEIIYTFANLINTNILKYTEYIIKNSDTDLYSDVEFVLVDKFFDGLNTILFGVYDNLEYIDLCQKFFSNYVVNYLYIDPKILNDSILFNIKTFDGTTSVNTISNTALLKKYFNSKSLNYYIKNNKINVWKFLIGICVDFNECEVIKQMKSVYEFNSIINVSLSYMNYIKEINGGYINELGIIKIFEYFKLYFDDEQIDFLNQQMYKIFVNLNVNLNIYPAIVDMLGLNYNYLNEAYLTNGLTSWIIKMGKKDFYMPINFFFKDNKNAIPLIACMYTNIKIDALFNSKNIFKNAYTINYLKPFNVTTALDMDFVFVEREERKKICEKNIDNLIETHGNYIKTVDLGDIVINPFDDTITIQFDFEINALVKEIIWEYSFYLGAYKITPNNYKKINEKSYNIYDFILNTKYYIDGARRDGVNNLEPNNYNGITKNLNPYRYNTRADANNNLNVYSFALEPEEFQPTGAINLNLYKVFSIQITMDKNALVNYLGNTNTLFNLKKLAIQINLTTIQYNLVRYQSGLSGLLFITNN